MVKVLICGDVRGEFATLRARVQALQSSAHGPFDVLFCCGVLADTGEHWSQVAAGLGLPLPLYFVGNPPQSLGVDVSRAQEEAVQVADNAFCLGNCGVQTVHRLCVGFVSAEAKPADVQRVQAIMTAPEFIGCDLLLSQTVPKDVHQFAPAAELPTIRSASMAGSAVCADVAQLAIPRYHIAASDAFFQRSPYKNFEEPPATKKNVITRFITLAPCSQTKDKSKKWLHALDLEPLAFMSTESLAAEPAGTTDFPYMKIPTADARKRARADKPAFDPSALEESKGDGRPTSFFFGDMGVPAQGNKRQRHANTGPVDPENKTLFIGGLPLEADETIIRGLFANIGCDSGIEKVRTVTGKNFAFAQFRSHEAAAEALNKAQTTPLTVGGQQLVCGWGVQSHARAPRPKQSEEARRLSARTDCWFCLASPNLESHLVVSIGSELYLAMPKGAMVDDHVLIVPIECVPNRSALSPSGKVELERYISALRRYFESRGEKLLLFERYMPTKGSQHFHIQVLPVPASFVPNCVPTFLAEAGRIRMNFQEILDTSMNPDDVLDRDYYFYIELPTASGCKKFIHAVKDNENIPMQLGREVAAKALNMPRRAHWKDCLLSTQQETVVAERFKANFKPFDFTLA